MKLAQIKASKPINEDWGSSDWYPVMQDMVRYLENHFEGKQSDADILAAGRDIAPTYMDSMGYDDADECAERIAHMYKVRKSNGHLPKIEESLLQEGYDERVAAAARYLTDHFRGQNVKREDVLNALHKYAVADPHAASVKHNWNQVISGKISSLYSNGVPDYNGSTKARAEFIRDVLACLKGKLRFGRAKMSAEERASAKQERKVAVRRRLDRIHSIVIDKISQTFPDGDPIDQLIPWMDKNKITMDEIDKAFEVNGDGSYNEYLIDMWDQLASDATHDAQNGHIDPNSPYYEVDNGKVEMRSNPWGKKSGKPKKTAARPDDDQPFTRKNSGKGTLKEDVGSLLVTPSGDGFVVNASAKSGPIVGAVFHVWKAFASKNGVKIAMKSGKELDKGPGTALKLLDNRPQGLVFHGVSKDDLEAAAKEAVAKVERELKAKEKHNAGAPQRKKEAQTFANLQRKADTEAYDKEYGKGTWKRVTYKQEGGDDGYQYVVRVDGRAVVNGQTLRQAKHVKRQQVDAIAKREKLGKYTEGK